MNRYAFILSQLEIGETRGKQNTDDYIVTFSVKINDVLRGSGSGRLVSLAKGATVPMQRPDRRDRMNSGWVIGPFELEEGDHVVVTITGTNIGDSEWRISQEESEKLQMKILESVVTAAAGVLTGVIGATASGAISALLSPMSEFLGWEAPERCNGLVFADEIEFRLSQIERLSFVEELPNMRMRNALVVRDYTDEATHDTEQCGAIARTRVTMRVREEYGPVAVKVQAIRQRETIDVRKGLRQLLPTNEPISVKQLLNMRG